MGDADTLLAVVRKEPPDVVITDVRMPPGHSDEGLRAAAAIRAELPAIGILVLSQYVADAYLSSLLESTTGGIGYLLKDRVGHVTEFLESLDRVAEGGTVVDPEVVRQLLARRRDDGPLAALTPRELEVLALMAEGRVNCVDRRAVGGERGRRTQACRQHLREAAAGRRPRPPGLRRAHVSARLT